MNQRYTNVLGISPLVPRHILTVQMLCAAMVQLTQVNINLHTLGSWCTFNNWEIAWKSVVPPSHFMPSNACFLLFTLQTYRYTFWLHAASPLQASESTRWYVTFWAIIALIMVVTVYFEELFLSQLRKSNRSAVTRLICCCFFFFFLRRHCFWGLYSPKCCCSNSFRHWPLPSQSMLTTPNTSSLNTILIFRSLGRKRLFSSWFIMNFLHLF